MSDASSAPATLGPAYRIVTPRSVIRCWEPTDATGQLEALLDNLDHLRPWLPWAQDTPTLERQLGFLRECRARFDRGEDYTFGVFAPTGEVIGGAGLHTRLGPGVLEIGYWIHGSWTGKGLATEIAAALTRVAFEIERVDRVEIRVVPDNVRSARVAQKLGFRHEGTLRRRLPFGDLRLDMMLWTLFADEHASSVAAAVATAVAAYDALGRPLLTAV